MRIYLIGMPGSGKTTIGKKLAEKLVYPFIDLDARIEKDALMFIDDIFEKYGEQTFRRLETESLMSIKEDDAVISCGGGIVTIKDNKAKMNGYKVYLNTELDIIKERLIDDVKRPLLRKKSLEQLYEERMLKYIDFADVIIANDHDEEKTVDAIINHLKEVKS
jgi:shikimate kinase